MAKITGCLARAGKVKFSMTRRVEPTNTEHSYSKQGRCKYRIKSTDSNDQYSSGSYRLDDKVSNGDSNRVILNSYHKYNCEKGYQKIEHSRNVAEHKQSKWKHQKYDRNRDTNHQKWHRNHPKDGFYQKREEFPLE